MKKLTLLIAFVAMMTMGYSQDETTSIPEPEWAGEAIFVDNGKVVKLESQKAFIKANASASMYIVGVGNVKSKFVVKGKTSPVRLKQKKDLTFIVNADGNSVNPKTVVQIVKLQSKRKKRFYIGGKTGTFTGTKMGDLELVPFKAKKYGENSYKIFVPKIEDGEYTIIINGSMDWNLFGIE